MKAESHVEIPFHTTTEHAGLNEWQTTIFLFVLLEDGGIQDINP